MPDGIRLAASDDGRELAEIYAPAVIERATSFELVAPDAAEISRRVDATQLRTPWLVYTLGHQIAGYAYASTHRVRPAYQWSVDVSAYVRPDQQRRGVGRALYTSLFAVLTLQGFRNAYAGIALPNDASVKFHEASGFTRVGVYHRVGHKLGAWHDVMWLERSLAEHTADPSEPVALARLLGSELLTEAICAGSPL